MDPFKHNLKIYQGASFSNVTTWETGKPASPVNLTGCTARMQARAKISDSATLLNLTTENGGIELGGTAGTVTINISAADTAAIQWKGAVYDLEIVFADGKVRRHLEGSISVSPEVTR